MTQLKHTTTIILLLLIACTTQTTNQEPTPIPTTPELITWQRTNQQYECTQEFINHTIQTERQQGFEAGIKCQKETIHMPSRPRDGPSVSECINHPERYSLRDFSNLSILKNVPNESTDTTGNIEWRGKNYTCSQDFFDFVTVFERKDSYEKGVYCTTKECRQEVVSELISTVGSGMVQPFNMYILANMSNIGNNLLIISTNDYSRGYCTDCEYMAGNQHDYLSLKDGSQSYWFAIGPRHFVLTEAKKFLQEHPKYDGIITIDEGAVYDYVKFGILPGLEHIDVVPLSRPVETREEAELILKITSPAPEIAKKTIEVLSVNRLQQIFGSSEYVSELPEDTRILVHFWDGNGNSRAEQFLLTGGGKIKEYDGGDYDADFSTGDYWIPRLEQSSDFCVDIKMLQESKDFLVKKNANLAKLAWKYGHLRTTIGKCIPLT